MKKQITNIMNGMPTQDGAGVNLTRVIGQPALRNLDPFLMLDEIRSDNPNDYIAGFPPHPHKGFETLSYMIQGSMEHNDSTGGHGLITSGGVQYMTAGKGIVHSETPKQDSGLLFGFQLWLNLPSKDKLQPPRYIDIPKQSIPVIDETTAIQGKGRIKVIAGQFNGEGEVGPVVRDDIQAEIYDITLTSGSLETRIANEKQGFLYVYQGEITINGNKVSTKQIAVLSEGELVNINNNDTEAGFLLLAAQPIGEPIVQYGPFVMNKMSEIDTALKDYQSGNFV
ncbi:pirin family protein [Psychrosphaera sp.]|nr:pirin family protein [Psychrosphaera sp.]